MATNTQWPDSPATGTVLVQVPGASLPGGVARSS